MAYDERERTILLFGAYDIYKLSLSRAVCRLIVALDVLTFIFMSFDSSLFCSAAAREHRFF